jgi:hypothetical protein
MRRRHDLIALVLALCVGCGSGRGGHTDGGEDADLPDGDTDGDSDGDADTDADTDADGDGEIGDPCGDDGDCSERLRCFLGLCRRECGVGDYCPRPGACLLSENLCVGCTVDTDCRGGGQQTCDPTTYSCADVAIEDPVIGVMYHQWWTPGRWIGDRGNYVYEPVLGHYDNTDPEVVRQHGEWAELAGINTWVLDTWITDRDDAWVVPNTAAVMDEADRRGLRYFFLVDGWFEFEGSDGGSDAFAIASRVNAKLGPHFDRPGYLHADGRPVVFFWAAWGHPCEAFDAIRAGIEGTMGPIFLTGNNGDPSCWDRMMEYNPYTSLETTYDGQIRRQEDLWSGMEERGFPWAPTAMPGYDDTHVREGNPPIPLDADFFARSLRTALQYNQYAPPWLFVCSWSEWHEGSNIEPSTDFPDPLVFLDTMHDELDAAGWL